MRAIPTALKLKLLNRFKQMIPTASKHPSVATQTSINTLLSEPIHEGRSPALA
jgi:hypothetical protein